MLSPGGCGRSAKDCAAEPSSEAQDWCWFERSGEAVDDDKMDAAIGRLSMISSPMIRAAAIDRLFADAADSLDRDTALSLCSGLSDPFREPCISTWNRPHLWKR